MNVTRMCREDEALAWGEAHEALDTMLEDAEMLHTSLLHAAGWARPEGGAPGASSVAPVPYYALVGLAETAHRVTSALYDLMEVADARSSLEVARHGDV